MRPERASCSVDNGTPWRLGYRGQGQTLTRRGAGLERGNGLWEAAAVVGVGKDERCSQAAGLGFKGREKRRIEELFRKFNR